MSARFSDGVAVGVIVCVVVFGGIVTGWNFTGQFMPEPIEPGYGRTWDCGKEKMPAKVNGEVIATQPCIAEVKD